MISTATVREKYTGLPCPYCAEPMTGRRGPTREHVVPKSKGGRDGDSNIIIACKRCNHDKGDLHVAEFYAWLLARGDARSAVVVDLICNACEDDPGAIADFFADAGLWLVKNGLVSRRHRGGTYDKVHNIMAQLNVPRTHWSFDPPATVKVFAKSSIIPVRFVDVHRFRGSVEELLGVVA